MRRWRDDEKKTRSPSHSLKMTSRRLRLAFLVLVVAATNGLRPPLFMAPPSHQSPPTNLNLADSASPSRLPEKLMPLSVALSLTLLMSPGGALADGDTAHSHPHTYRGA